jgi:hypothetical protein
VLERVQTRFSDQFESWVQYFNHTFEQTRDIFITGPDGEDVAVLTLLYNNATPLPGGVTGALVDTPVDDAKGTSHETTRKCPGTLTML